MKKLTAALLVFLLTMSLCACDFFGKKEETPTTSDTEHTITFDTNGVQEVIAPITVPNGETATMPIPTKEGHVFVGWYLDAELTNRYFFDYPLSENTTLYAKFYALSLGEYTVIANVDQLNAIKDDPAAKYLLACDINCKGETLVPIDEFTGELEGNGYKIHNFSMNEDADNVALIRINRGTVKNLSFADFTYDVVRNNGLNHFYGIICGENYGTVENCVIIDSKLSINCLYYGGADPTIFVGAIAGKNLGTVRNCKNNAEMKLSIVTQGAWNDGSHSHYKFGGIVGMNDGGTVTDCTNSNHLDLSSNTQTNAANYLYVAGIVGVNSGTVKDNTNASNLTITCTGNQAFLWIGGTVGADTGIIQNCSTVGAIEIDNNTASGGTYVGGLIGHTTGIIENGSSQGEITISNTLGGPDHYVGGFVGYTCGKIYNCYSANNITYNTANINAIGGFAGFNEKKVGEEFLINKCFATGNISLQSTPVNVGKFIGLTTGTEKDCYYLDTMTITQTTVVEEVETNIPVEPTNNIGVAKAESALLCVDFLENTLYFDRMVWFLVDGQLPKLR